MIQLGVNIDHVATLRQARYREGPPGSGEPDPVRAVHEAELGGADCITVHLREDRRHINDRDLELCRALARVEFNLEMAATDEMVAIAARVKPHLCTLVPEGRAEVTTEGGLDVRGQVARLRGIVSRLKDSGAHVSAFIDADLPQIDAARSAGFDACEVHTGPYAAAYAACGGQISRNELSAQLGRIATAGGAIAGAGMRFHAGHALNYVNVVRIADLPGIAQLHIGHAIVSRSLFTGLEAAVREMKSIMLHAHRRA
ncbi:MAG: pyridoxine 5'-phosphate synthase [Phycisphaerales bacterium]